MKIFIDGEWNSYRGELISLALVAEDGREFYEVLGCDTPEPWVADNVMPALGKEKISRGQFTEKLDDFLRSFGTFQVVADWPEDIEHFCRALIVGPGERIGPNNWTMEVVRLPSDAAPSVLPHNALEDARAIAKYLIGQARASLQGGAKCIWRETEEMWEADCGAAWTFNDGGPKENSMKHCHVCGKEIDVDACHARKEG